MQYLFVPITVFFLYSCGGEINEHSLNQNGETQIVSLSGEKIFKQYCVLCHGVDGKLGLNGSKDLTISKLPMDSVFRQIRKGKGTMPPYMDVLSDAEIDSVYNYVISLRKND